MKAKRLVLLLLAGCLVCGLSGRASALEVTVSGQMVFQLGIMDNYVRGGKKFTDEEADHFFARQRVRTQIEFIASENLRGVLQLQMGTTYWGDARTGGQLDTNSSSPMTRQAYIDWKVQDTGLQLKMGLQLLAMPNAVAGTPILDTTVAAVVASYALNDNVSLGAFWARPYTNQNADKLKNNDMDLFSLLADFDYDSFRIQPYVLYGRVGSESGIDAAKWNGNLAAPNATKDRYSNVYLGGLAASFKPLDDLTVNFDGIYTYMKNEANDTDGGFDKAKGYFLALGVDYDFSVGTLGGIAWYSSGDDKDDAADGEYGQLVTFSRGNSGFKPTRFGTAGAYAMGDDCMISGTGAGTWGAGLHFKNVSFVQDLTHAIRAYYFQSTNDKELYLTEKARFGDGMYLTKKDKGFELNLDSQYEIAKGFKAILEIGYINVDWYKEKARGFNEDDIFNAQLTFDYRF